MPKTLTAIRGVPPGTPGGTLNDTFLASTASGLAATALVTPSVVNSTCTADFAGRSAVTRRLAMAPPDHEPVPGVTAVAGAVPGAIVGWARKVSLPFSAGAVTVAPPTVLLMVMSLTPAAQFGGFTTSFVAVTVAGGTGTPLQPLKLTLVSRVKPLPVRVTPNASPTPASTYAGDTPVTAKVTGAGGAADAWPRPRSDAAPTVRAATARTGRRGRGCVTCVPSVARGRTVTRRGHRPKCFGVPPRPGDPDG
jgi:hypothetical protein